MGCLHSKPCPPDAAPPAAEAAAKPSSAAGAPQPDGPAAPLSNGQANAKDGPGESGQKSADGSRADDGATPPAEGEPSSPLMVVWRDEVPVPADEQHRFDVLCSYNILDTEPEEAYDRITALCKTLFNVPIAMVTFVDKDRAWLKSVQGLCGLKQVDRRVSLCAWTLLSRFPEALVVPDLREDVRFKEFPVVTGWPHARFYAACPLVNSANARLGTLCILDTKPREFSADHTTLLTQLANMVMREVERKRAMNDALCSAALRHNSGSSISHDSQGIMLCDMATPKWAIYLVNDAWQRITGISQAMAAGGHFWDLFEPPLPAQVQAYQLAIEQHRNFELRVPVNVGNYGANVSSAHEALLHSSGASSLTGDGGSGFMLPLAQQGPMHGVSGWGTSSSEGLPAPPQQPASAAAAAAAASAQQRQQPPPPQRPPHANDTALGSGGSGPGSAHTTPPLPPLDPSRRRSLGGGMRYIRFQFRSVSSVASHMAPAVSIPPALVSSTASGNNYYWATVDAPLAASLHGGDSIDGSLSAYTIGLTGAHPHGHPQHVMHLQPGDASFGSAPPSSGPHTMPSSDTSSTPAHGPMRTTFSLLPEDNPFQDITIGSLLGWGSYGRVHRGYWNGSLVAVKVLEQVAGDSNPRSSLEPLLHHRLSHPNVVAMFDVCTQEVDVCDDGRPLQEVWMVLEFCNRGTLGDAIQRGWLLSVRDGVPLPGLVNMQKALSTAREVAGAMEYLHSQNVLHGDLNGNNILLAGTHVPPGGPDQRGFTAKVADFGLSRLLSPENEKIITRTHGTITHMAPEVITEATHSKAADVYSFGVVLFELLSGAKPYTGMHYAQIVAHITSGKLLQLLPQHAAQLPRGLGELMNSCLAMQAAERPTFAHVHAQLRQLEQQVIQEQQALQQQQQLAAPPLPQQQAAAAPPQQQAAAVAPQQPQVVLPPPQAAVAATIASVAAASDGSLSDVFAAAGQQLPPTAAAPPASAPPTQAGA